MSGERDSTRLLSRVGPWYAGFAAMMAVSPFTWRGGAFGLLLPSTYLVIGFLMGWMAHNIRAVFTGLGVGAAVGILGAADSILMHSLWQTVPRGFA